MRARLTAVVALGVLLGVAALIAPRAGAESSPSAYASRLVTLINDARAQHGLKALTVTSGTSTVAVNWTNHLDQQQALSHNPDLGHQLETHGSPHWTAYGENVGDGPTSSADKLFEAYMNSPEHRDNILGSAYRYLGIGVVFDHSMAWNTLDFVDQYASSRPRTTSTTTTQPKTKPRTTVARQTTTARPATHRAPVAHAAVPARHAPRPAAAHKVQVRGVASAVPTAAPALPPVTTAAVSLPAPVRLPTSPRDALPIIVAAAAILVVVATRYVVEVFPRAAVTGAQPAR